MTEKSNFTSDKMPTSVPVLSMNCPKCGALFMNTQEGLRRDWDEHVANRQDDSTCKSALSLRNWIKA